MFPSKTEPLGRFLLLTAVDIRPAEPAWPYVIIISQRDPWTNLYQQYLQLQFHRKEAEAENFDCVSPWAVISWRTADSSLIWWKWINTETTQWRVWKTSCYFSWPRVSRFSRLSWSCLLSCNAEVITLEIPPSPTGVLINLRNAALTDVSKGTFCKEGICCKVEVNILASITTHTANIVVHLVSPRPKAHVTSCCHPPILILLCQPLAEVLAQRNSSSLNQKYILDLVRTGLEMTFCSTSAWYLISHNCNISLQITSGFPCNAIIHLRETRHQQPIPPNKNKNRY